MYGKTRVEVGGKLAKALSDSQGGLVFDDEGLTIGKYLDKWLEGSLRGIPYGRAPSTATR